MYSKLAFKNIKRSFKDYTIYFLTLVFGVSIFYIFNSIESQSIMMDISEAHIKTFKMISSVLGVVSVFIAFILGFLIVYSNNYLIKRRKKEFGVYMTLGMDNNKLAFMLFIETMIVGIISLALGLIIGTIGSQFLSIITAKLFKVKLLSFKFIFSKEACIKTMMCFGIIYLVVLIFNSFVVRQVKLINLLTAEKKNEKIKVRSLWLSVVIFIISIVLIGTGYYMVLKYGITVLDKKIIVAIILGASGTFLLFFSLTGFLLKLAQGRKNIYFKNLNMFVLRQINSKINTTFISMTFICLMLFVAICTFSGGMGISTALNRDVDELAQFDGCMWNTGQEDIKDILEKENVNLEDYSDKYAFFTMYNSGVNYWDYLTDKGREGCKKYYQVIENEPVQVIKLSDFNSVMKVLGKEELDLEKGKYALFADMDDTMDRVEDSLKKGVNININNNELSPAKAKVIDVILYNSMFRGNICAFIVNDEVLEGSKSELTYLSINYKDKDKSLDEIVTKIDVKDENRNIIYFDKDTVIMQSISLGAMASYLAIYLGIIFIITSAAVLAIQQLSEADDNRERYGLLRKLGVDESMINKSILVQIAIYFVMPLVVAIIHSIVGLKLSADIVTMLGNGSMIVNATITAIVLVIIYGGYFLATYSGSKKMAK